MSRPSETATSYDEVPYSSYPYPQSHPDRLATVATLFGMRPAPVDKCRVLELGCCSGGNLIPMAERFPDSQFVGIDASNRQITDGRGIIQELALKNIDLQHADIMSVSAELGQFDYIIAHGVFSWVPREVQEQMFRICRDHLAEQGVAYISYNTYPGWRMRGLIRDLMCYRTRGFQKPEDRVRHARSLLDFLAQTVPTENNAYGMLLKDELNLIRDKEDHYLLHEHLEDVNDPVYFHEFIERANASNLQYVGESDFRVMSVSNFPRQVEAVLHSVASNLIEMEQYMDFVRNRMFRQTILCHADVVIDRSLSPTYVQTLHVASSSKPERHIEDLQDGQTVKFIGPSAVMTTNDSVVKAAMLHLGEIWPQSISFRELLASARSRLNSQPVVIDTSSSAVDARRLAEPMIRSYATSQVELSTTPCTFSLATADRPLASNYARYQAARSGLVTNQRHESVNLDDLQRRILALLDGTRNREQVSDLLTTLVLNGDLLVHSQGQLVKDESRCRQILVEEIARQLPYLSSRALLLRGP